MMKDTYHLPDNKILKGLISKNKKVLKHLKKKNFEMLKDKMDKDYSTVEDAVIILDFIIDKIANELKQAEKAGVNTNKLFNKTFDNDYEIKGLKTSWEQFVSELVVTGIKVNDERTCKFLYDYFYPRAKKLVLLKSGSVDDAQELLQETIIKLLLMCRKEGKDGKGFHHENILALIMVMLKNTWIDMFRKRMRTAFMDINNEQIKTDMYPSEPKIKMFPNLNMIREFAISKKYLKRMKKKYRMEDFLDYSNLNDTQKKMIEVLLDMQKSNPVCKKLLLLTIFLPIADTEVIAGEMGYIKEKTKAGIESGLATLSTQKNRCIKRLKEYLNR